MNIITTINKTLLMTLITSLFIYRKLPTLKYLSVLTVSIILYKMFIYNIFPGDRRDRYL